MSLLCLCLCMHKCQDSPVDAMAAPKHAVTHRQSNMFMAGKFTVPRPLWALMMIGASCVPQRLAQ